MNHLDPSGLGFFSFLKKVFGWIAKIAFWVTVAVVIAVVVTQTAFLVFGFKWALTAWLWLTKATGAIMGTVIFSATESASGVTAGEVILGLAGVGAVGEFLQRGKPSSKGPDPRKVKTDFYERYGAILNNCIKQLFGRDARKIPIQTIKNSPILDSRLTGRQIGVLSNNGGAPSGWQDLKGRYGTVYLRKEYYLSKLPYTMEWIHGTFAHELGNILDARLHPKDTVRGQNYGNKNDPFDLDTGAALQRCMFGAIRFPDGAVR